MAWTTPRTWTDGELVTAAIMNAHVRDNLGVVPHFIPKTALQTVSASTTVVDDTHLQFAVATNTFYWVSGALWHEASTTGHFKYTFTGPAGYDGHITSFGVDTAGSTIVVNSNVRDAAEETSFFSGTTGIMTWFQGVFSTAGTSGTFKLRWAQNTATGTTTLKKGSYMMYALTTT